MARDVFPNEKVGEYFNSKFINCKIKCDDKGYGKKLSKKYNVTAFPTLMFIDKNGNIVHSMAGGPGISGLIQFTKDASNPDKNIYYISQKFRNGDRSHETIEKYFSKLMKAYRKTQASNDFINYFNSLNKKEKESIFIFNLMKKVNIAPFTKPFEYVENNKDVFYNLSSKEIVDDYIASTYKACLSRLQCTDYKKYKDVLCKFKNKGYDFYNEYLAYFNVLDVVYENDNGYDVQEYIRRGTAFLDKYRDKSDGYTIHLTSLLGNLAYGKDVSLAGIEWMEKLLKKNRNPKYLSTYIYILIRNIHREKAKKVGLELREYYLKNNISTKQLDRQLEEISKN